jgi:hypothetical protein
MVTEALHMKDYEWENFALDNVTPPLKTSENEPPYAFIAEWMGTRANPDGMEERKYSCSYRESNPGRPALSPASVSSNLLSAFTSYGYSD